MLTAFIGQQKMELKSILTFLLHWPFLNDCVFAVFIMKELIDSLRLDKSMHNKKAERTL